MSPACSLIHNDRTRTRSVRAGQGRAGQGSAGQGRAGQGRVGQGRVLLTGLLLEGSARRSVRPEVKPHVRVEGHMNMLGAACFSPASLYTLRQIARCVGSSSLQQLFYFFT